MTTYKRIDGDYYIQTLEPPVQKVYIDTDTTVTGNLTVQGNLTYINVDELNITDPFILLNASNTATYAANSGVLTHITSSTFAGIRYSDDTGQWELSVDTSSSGETGTWTPISTGSSVVPGGANTNIQFNDSGSFGGNANLSFDYAVSKLTLQGHEVFGNIGTAPTAVANSVAVYHNAEGSGGTGLYVKSLTTEDELVSKAKAIVFSIIF
jgi:hypothetical protein